MRDSFWAILIALAVVIFFVLGGLYAKFQWTECRKDPDHSFWFCMQVLD